MFIRMGITTHGDKYEGGRVKRSLAMGLNVRCKAGETEEVPRWLTCEDRFFLAPSDASCSNLLSKDTELESIP